MDIERLRKLAGLTETARLQQVHDDHIRSVHPDAKHEHDEAEAEVDEAAEFDFGHREQGVNKTTTYRVPPDHHNKGRADVAHRMVNNMGDNPMPNDNEVFDEIIDSTVVDEAAEFDFGHAEKGTNKLTPLRIPPDHHNKGRADVAHRMVNNMGDNPMPQDPADKIRDDLDEDEDVADFSNDDLNRLHDALRPLNVDDARIRSGVELSDSGYMKLARKFGRAHYQPEQAKRFIDGMLIALANRMAYDQEQVGEEQELTEFGAKSERYGFVPDYMGNVTLTDTLTGKSHYFQGSEAIELVRGVEAAKDNPAQIQMVLAQYQGILESYCQECDGDRGRYDEGYEWESCASCAGSGMDSNKPVLQEGGEEFDFTGTIERDVGGESTEIPITIHAIHSGGDAPFGRVPGKRYDEEPQSSYVEIISATDPQGNPVELTPDERAWFSEKGLQYHDR